MHACEVVVAHFIHGSQTCDVVATKKISDAGEERYICDEHFEQYIKITRPDPKNYDFYYHVNDEGYDSDDWDEEIYYYDLRKWTELKAQD